MKLGAARQKAPSAWRLVAVELAEKEATFRYRLRRDKLRQARRREGRYLLRTNLTETDPAKLWHFYLQLVAVEEALRTSRGIWPSVPFSINSIDASRHISSSPSSPTVCTLP